MVAKYITYESLDEGKIARITLNRVNARNAQNRGLLVELGEAFKQAEADDQVRVVILAGAGPMFSSGHDLGSKEAVAERTPGPDLHPSYTVNGGTRVGAENRMLQEWHYFFQNTLRVAQSAQDHHRPGPRERVRGRPDADVVLRPDRGGRQCQLRRCGRHPARDVRPGVLRPSVGVRPSQGQGTAADRRLARRRGGPLPGDGVEDLPGG